VTGTLSLKMKTCRPRLSALSASAVDVTSTFVRDGVVLYQQVGPAASSERKTSSSIGVANAVANNW
jgi:hypothetical protein